MKYVILITLVCLVLVGSVAAIQAPISVPLKQNISMGAKPGLLAVPCSNDSFVGTGSYGILWLKNWTNGGWSDCPCDVVLKIDGAQVHVWGYNGEDLPLFKVYLNPGTRSYQVTTGTGTETGTIIVCANKTTYLYLNKPTPAVTTPATAAVTSTVTTMPATTATTMPATSTAVTGETAATASVTPLGSTNPSAPAPAGAAAALTDTTGSLSITTTPAGAFIFIDGVQRGVSPATIPDLSAGMHTLLLKLDGYQDLSTPVTIAAGSTRDYSSALAKDAETDPTRSPGFEFVAALFALGTIILVRTRL